MNAIFLFCLFFTLLQILKQIGSVLLWYHETRIFHGKVPYTVLMITFNSLYLSKFFIVSYTFGLNKQKVLKLFKKLPHPFNMFCFKQCCGSMTFWCGSGSADSCLWFVDPDSDPDHPIFVIDLQEANKKQILFKKISAYKLLRVHLHNFYRVKNQKEVTKQ